MPDDLISNFTNLLEHHLEEQEQRRRAVSLLATGAAFESWLSFETRLLMEHERNALGLNERIMDPHNEPIYRYAIMNENTKIDLGVVDVANGDEVWDVAIEFKIVHNNKNWKAKCEEVWADLFPAKGTPKASIQPRRGRFAAVAVVGKVYRDPGPYGWRDDLPQWEQELWDYMLPPCGEHAGKVTRRSRTRRFALHDHWLVKNAQHFCELHVLARSPTIIVT